MKNVKQFFKNVDCNFSYEKMCKTKLQDAILFFIKKKKKDVKNREKDLRRVLSLKLVV